MKQARLMWFVLAIIAGGVLSYVAAQQEPKNKAPKESVTVELKNGQGESVGNAVITAIGKEGVRIKLDVKNLPAGEHGFHFHEMGKCEGPKFESAGAHFNPDKKMHGLKNPQGAHAGDMMNFTVRPNGTSTQTVTNKFVNMGDQGGTALFGGNGTSLVIHAKADDQKTDPSGNSGDRIACGVVTKG
ncbi:MAG TPA: superoxide dismutase family protein [Pyrinomonadaceae bacterium]|nr:superoxide dismutase family protein [Pyrinomonadaceae bacterium]